MSDDELKVQFDLCQQWQDPEQWERLALAYFLRGYVLNARYCLGQADALKDASVRFVVGEAVTG